MEEIKRLSYDNNYKKIRDTTLRIEKQILDNYKNNDFKRLIDNIILSNYSFFNTLLIDYQYPNFLDLATENKYHKQNIDVLKNAKKINILSPMNDIYVKIKDKNTERIDLLDNLNNEELKRYNNINDLSVTLHSKELKSLNIIELFDCKDTTMPKNNYKNLELPPLFNFDYNDIYPSFVKALYSTGYKIKYCDNIDNKFVYDKNNKIVNIKNGLNSKTKILCLLDVYTSDMTNNDFDKKLLSYTINKHLGYDDHFLENNSFTDWYKNTNIKDVEYSLKLISSKAKKFAKSFNKFFEEEKKNFDYNDTGLYENFNLSI